MTNAKIVDVEYENLNQEGAGNQVNDDAQATQKTEVLLPSSSISSDYAAKFLNFDNIPLADTKFVSMLDSNVQHEVLRTSPLLTIPVSVIPEHTNQHRFQHQQQLKLQIQPLLFLTLKPLLLSIKEGCKRAKRCCNSTKVISTIKSEVQNAVKEYLGSCLDDALHKVIQRNFTDIIKEHSVPAEIVERLRQQYAPLKFEAQVLYHALMESILEDEDAMDEGVAKKLKKRKPNDADKDEGPSARSDRGLKRQRTSKGPETSKKTSATKDSSKGKSPATSSKSTKSGKSLDYADMPMDQGESLGNTDEQPNDEDVPNNDWYKKSRSDTSLDPEWNEGKSVDDGPKQSWLNDMAKATKPPLTFDELMHTPIDFSAFVMNHLKIDNLTIEILVGPAYNLLKGTCKSYVELDYTMEECYRALSEQLDWNNPEGHHCPYDLTKPLPVQMSSQGYELKGIDDIVPNLWSLVKVVYDRYALLGISHWRTKRQNFYGYTTKMVSKKDVYSTKRILSIISVKVNEWYGYSYLEEIVVKRANKKLYTFKEGDFKRLRLNDIEDMLLLVVQNKIHNLNTNVIAHLVVNLRMFARRMVIQARVEDLQLGVESYQKKLNFTKPRTQDVDMSHRPADDTLISVRNTLSQMLHELHLGYNKTMRRRKWTRLDLQRTHIMIKTINQKLLDRRITMSLEEFVGGRDYGEDLRLLQLTI
ncbi:hypothetical protein Tco_0950254 [Tanacetum coccineum]